jgi:hypothetical protein
MILFERGHARSLGYDDLAFIVLDFARQYAEKGRLAGAVRPYDAVAIARREFEVYILEEASFPEAQSQVGYRYHRKDSPSKRA